MGWTELSTYVEFCGIVVGGSAAAFGEQITGSWAPIGVAVLMGKVTPLTVNSYKTAN